MAGGVPASLTEDRSPFLARARGKVNISGVRGDISERKLLRAMRKLYEVSIDNLKYFICEYNVVALARVCTYAVV